MLCKINKIYCSEMILANAHALTVYGHANATNNFPFHTKIVMFRKFVKMLIVNASIDFRRSNYYYIREIYRKISFAEPLFCKCTKESLSNLEIFLVNFLA